MSFLVTDEEAGAERWCNLLRIPPFNKNSHPGYLIAGSEPVLCWRPEVTWETPDCSKDKNAMPLALESPCYCTCSALGSEEVWLGTFGPLHPELRRQGHSQPTHLAASHWRKGAGHSPERIPHKKYIACWHFYDLGPLTKHRLVHSSAFHGPAWHHMLAPGLPLGVRKTHIFPSSDRPSGSSQVQKANKSPAKPRCIYQSGGLSSSGLDPHERQTREGRGGARRGGAAAQDTWCELGAGSANVHSSEGPRGGPTPPPSLHALPFALKSGGWGTGVELSRSSSLGLLIFTSRLSWSYFGRNESYKGSVGIQGVTSCPAALSWIFLPSWPGNGKEWRHGGEPHKAIKGLCVGVLLILFLPGSSIEDVNSSGLLSHPTSAISAFWGFWVNVFLFAVTFRESKWKGKYQLHNKWGL